MKVSDEVCEIFYSDLVSEAQKKLLKFLGIKSPDQMNLDVFPVAQVPKGDGK